MTFPNAFQIRRQDGRLLTFGTGWFGRLGNGVGRLNIRLGRRLCPDGRNSLMSQDDNTALGPGKNEDSGEL